MKIGVSKMKESIEIRLTNLAQKVADMYKNRISEDDYKMLCNAINACRDYHIKGQTEWVSMYDVILCDDGIWIYGECDKFEDEIKDMWALETDILMCNCYLGCMAEDHNTPQDLEIQGDNIEEFVEFLVETIKEEIDYDKIFEFWNERMCY